MGHPQIESQPLLEDQYNGPIQSIVKQNYLKMTILFSINHGCTVACLDLANARLGSIGVWQSGALYFAYTLSALCGASYFVKGLGSRNGLALGMGMSASYVTSFFVASLVFETKRNGTTTLIQRAVAIFSAVLGGVGGSILWVSQGTYFSAASELFASAGGAGGLVEDATSSFAGAFSSSFLLIEVILRLLSSFLIHTAGFSWQVIFGFYATLSILPVVLMMLVMDVEEEQSCKLNQAHYGTGGATLDDQDESALPSDLPSHKATAALDLLRKDPKALYLAPLNLLFGLSTAFCSSVLNGAIIREVLSDPNASYVGMFTSVTSIVASVSSLLFGILQSSKSQLFHCGKIPVMTFGALCYFFIALQFIAYPDGSDWSRIRLLLVYILLGVGRATFEGTLRAIYADFFSTEKEGAYGNIVLFSGLASTGGFVLSVTGFLQCDQVSRYCLEYHDGSIHNVLFMETAMIATAAIAIPSLWRAVWLFRQETDPAALVE